MNIYYLKSESSEGRITAYGEKCWLSKLANGELHLRLCKDTDLEVDRRGFLKVVWSEAGQPQKSARKASDQHTRWQSETSNLFRNLLSVSINVSN
jgi:hypothetical protein